MEESVWSPIHDREVQPGFSDFEFPEGELTTLRRSSRQKKYICVIGGGIAGLTAAYELLDPAALTPHEVVLVEATGRLGGRIRTWHKDGMTGEFGPMRFPQNHAGTIRYVNSLGLSTGVFIQSNPNAWCQVGGFKYRRSDFDTLLTEYEATHKTQLRNLWIRGSVDPQANMHELLKKQIDGKLRSSPGDDPLKSIARDFDHVSLWQLIRHVDISPRGQIAGPDYIRYSYRPPFGSAPELLTQEQWEVLGRASGMRWTEGMSALEEYVDAYGILGGDERLRLLDGMDALPNKLAEKIIQDRDGEIVVNTRVNGVVREGNAGERCMRVFSDKGEITAADGNAFHYVICAVPASATARMAFVPSLRPEKQTALTGTSLPQRREDSAAPAPQDLGTRGESDLRRGQLHGPAHPAVLVSVGQRDKYGHSGPRGPAEIHKQRRIRRLRSLHHTRGLRRPGWLATTGDSDWRLHDGRERRSIHLTERQREGRGGPVLPRGPPPQDSPRRARHPALGLDGTARPRRRRLGPLRSGRTFALPGISGRVASVYGPDGAPGRRRWPDCVLRRRTHLSAARLDAKRDSFVG